MKQTLTQRVSRLEKKFVKKELLHMTLISNLQVRINCAEHYGGLHDKGCTCQGEPVNPDYDTKYCECKYPLECANLHKPYTAMRSTGELTENELEQMKNEYKDFLNKKDMKLQTGSTGEPPYGVYPIKPQEDVRNSIVKIIKREKRMANIYDKELDPNILADKILAIVKGE